MPCTVGEEVEWGPVGMLGTARWAGRRGIGFGGSWDNALRYCMALLWPVPWCHSALQGPTLGWYVVLVYEVSDPGPTSQKPGLYYALISTPPQGECSPEATEWNQATEPCKG